LLFVARKAIDVHLTSVELSKPRSDLLMFDEQANTRRRV
jgi:hypothetical protein